MTGRAPGRAFPVSFRFAFAFFPLGGGGTDITRRMASSKGIAIDLRVLALLTLERRVATGYAFWTHRRHSIQSETRSFRKAKS